MKTKPSPMKLNHNFKRSQAAALVMAGLVATNATALADSFGSAGPAVNSARMIVHGRQTFRFDTFGDETFWGDTLGLHRTIAGAANGGIGPGLSPNQALALGLKVDANALPSSLLKNLRRGNVDLGDPASTLALLKLNSVVGVRGFFAKDRLESVGITCALCHSTVNDAVAPGIGDRLDGWANRDLNVGAIIAFAPNLRPLAELLQVTEDTVRQVLM
jgi:hypothetical protein